MLRAFGGVENILRIPLIREPILVDSDYFNELVLNPLPGSLDHSSLRGFDCWGRHFIFIQYQKIDSDNHKWSGYFLLFQRYDDDRTVWSPNDKDTYESPMVPGSIKQWQMDWLKMFLSGSPTKCGKAEYVLWKPIDDLGKTSEL
jgi:hypothetical protein